MVKLGSNSIGCNLSFHLSNETYNLTCIMMKLIHLSSFLHLILDENEQVSSNDPLEVLLELITKSGSKKIKEALNRLIHYI
jgi:hypothetical protein